MNKKSVLIAALALLVAASLLLGACTGAKYSITFNANGGTVQQGTMRYNAGDQITPPIPQKDGQTFGGWYVDSGLTERFDEFNEMPDKNVTVFAKWVTGTSGRILFDSNGGSAVSEVYGVTGDPVVLPQSPVKTGYVFDGWCYDESLTQVFAAGTPFPKGEITLHARWSKDSSAYCFVTYNLNGQKTEVPVEKGQTIVPPSFGEGEQCDWYTDASCTQPYVFGEAAADVTLYGVIYSKGLAISEGVVTSYSGSAEQIYVPEKFGGANVTAIGTGAFENNNAITMVSLPNTVTAIGDYAFYNCQYLAAVNLSAKIKTVGKYAFANCVRLSGEADISGVSAASDGVFANSGISSVKFGSGLTEVGNYAFANCANLVSAQLPNSVETIYSYAFCDTAIESFNVPDRLELLGTGALKGCTKLASVTINSNRAFSVDSDNGYLLFGNTLVLYFTTEINSSETELILSRSISSVAPYAFYGNDRITKINASSATLERSALENMKALQSLTVSDFGEQKFLAYWFGASSPEENTSGGMYVPGSLKEVVFTAFSGNEVPRYAFYGCRGLSVISGLEKATTLGDYAFAYTALQSFSIGANVTSVGENTFRGATELTEISVDAANAAYSSFDGALYNKAQNVLKFVPPAKTSVKFAETITEIDNSAFNQSAVETLVVPDSVTRIGFGAFGGMRAIKELTVPFIGGSATQNRYMLYVFGATITPGTNNTMNVSGYVCPPTLRKVTVTTPTAEIPNYAFTYLTSVDTINTGADRTKIGDFAYYRTCIGATYSENGVRTEGQLTIENTVTSIGRYAFYDCRFIQYLVIGSGVESIGDNAFAYASALTGVRFEEGEKDLTVGRGAFLATTSRDENNNMTGSSLLESVRFSSNVVSIGQSAFSYAGVTGLGDETSTFTDLTITFAEGSRLREIGVSAFSLTALKEIALPSSVVTIGSIAFGSNPLLEKVTIGTKQNEATALTLIDDGAFAESPNLAEFTLYKSVSSLAQVPTLGTGKSQYAPGEGVFDYTSAQIYVPADSVELYRQKWIDVAGYILAIAED